ncbi:MAG: putative short chain dehydrogenase [Microbacteriaceae bacterium]|nr:putative short chain dehydrogenase [Microbacteriaceae bacterium]
MRTLRESIVLVTGAAMGMGALYARRAVAEGATVVLWDVDAPLLAEVAAELGPQARPYVVDLSDQKDIARAAALVRAEVGDPVVVINNAGIVRGKLFVDHDHDADIELTMRVNALAPMHVTREFLPAMLADPGESRIVNIASAAGLISNPRMSVYAASKWAVVGWSDSLRLELTLSGSARIKVTTVCPSFITTGMFAGARGPRLTPLMSPEAVVSRVWAAMRKGRPMLMLPAMVPVSKLFRGVLPVRAWDFVAGTVFRVYNSMDEFSGRPSK